jgi:tetratricopeptide (TPR) repeat protein
MNIIRSSVSSQQHSIVPYSRAWPQAYITMPNRVKEAEAAAPAPDASWRRIHLSTTRKLTSQENQALETQVRGCWCVQEAGHGEAKNKKLLVDGILEYVMCMVHHDETVQQVYDALLELEMVDACPASMAHTIAQVIAAFLLLLLQELSDTTATAASTTEPAAAATVAAADVGVEVTNSGSIVAATPSLDSHNQETTTAAATTTAVVSTTAAAAIYEDGDDNNEEKKCDDVEDDDDEEKGQEEEANLDNVHLRLENGDAAFAYSDYRLAERQYQMAISHLKKMIMICSSSSSSSSVANHPDLGGSSSSNGEEEPPEHPHCEDEEESSPPPATDSINTTRDDDDDEENSNENVEKLLAVALVKMNECRMARKEWKRVSVYAHIALLHDASNADAWYQLAKSLYHQKRLRPALEAAKKMEQHDDRGQRLMHAMRDYFFRVVEKNRPLFRRIIDSYRLWSHDIENEYNNNSTTTSIGDCTEGGGDGGSSNKVCMYSLYALKAQQQQVCIDNHAEVDEDEEMKPLMPLKHFRAYLRMGRGVLPDSLMPEKNKISYQALMAMATADDWANIGVTVTPQEIQEHYRANINNKNVGGGDDLVLDSLRSFAVSIAGPIHGEGHKDIMQYLSAEEDDDDEE